MKQQLERTLQEFRQKLSRTEQALQESLITENELRRSSEVCEQEQTPHRTKYDNTKCLSLKNKFMCVCMHYGLMCHIVLMEVRVKLVGFVLFLLYVGS